MSIALRLLRMVILVRERVHERHMDWSIFHFAYLKKMLGKFVNTLHQSIYLYLFFTNISKWVFSVVYELG